MWILRRAPLPSLVSVRHLQQLAGNGSLLDAGFRAKKARRTLGCIWRCKSDSTRSTDSIPEALPTHTSPFWTRRRNLSLLGRRIGGMSFSEAAGHLSFLFLGLGYLETDLLPLRTYAAAGVTCSILFQYFRLQPLWIPISWNAIFLLINIGMVSLLLKEDHDAHRQGDEAAGIFERVFRQSGLTIVDFMKLHAISETVRYSEGKSIAQEGETQTQLFLVLEGGLDILKHGIKIASAKEGDFIGELSYLKHERTKRADASEGCSSEAVADVRVRPGGAKLLAWHFAELRDLLSHHDQMSVAFHQALSKAVASKLIDTHAPPVMYRHLLQGVLVDGVVNHAEKEQLMRVRQALGLDEKAHNRELKVAGWSEEEFRQGYHTKLSSKEYESLVQQVLQDGTVDESGRAKLRMYRVKNGIDQTQHLRVLGKFGWSLDDYEEGRKGLYRRLHPSISRAITLTHSTATFVSQLAASMEKRDDGKGK